jgi:adenosyl cobinamide kinase/adenosyl cobinamide phosphate guanylyltransferase
MTLVVVVVTALQMPDGGRGRIRFHKEERLRHWIIVAVATEPELLPALHFSDS